MKIDYSSTGGSGNSMGNLCCGVPIIFLIGIIFFAVAVYKYLLYRKIRDVPTSKTRAAALGLAEFFGKAKCDAELYSPMSKARCTYYLFKIEYYESRGKHSDWRVIYSSRSSSPFYLEDDTGKILVDPKLAEIIISPDKKYRGHLQKELMFGEKKGILSTFDKKLDDDAAKFIESNPSINAAVAAYRNEELQITESYIAEGDPLYVIGTVETKEGASGSIGSENLIVKRGRDGIMYVSDAPEKKVLEKIRNETLIFGAVGIIFVGVVVFLLVKP